MRSRKTDRNKIIVATEKICKREFIANDPETAKKLAAIQREKFCWDSVAIVVIDSVQPAKPPRERRARRNFFASLKIAPQPKRRIKSTELAESREFLKSLRKPPISIQFEKPKEFYDGPAPIIEPVGHIRKFSPAFWAYQALQLTAYW